MNIEFTGVALSDGRKVTSNCISQLIRGGESLIFLKSDKSSPGIFSWVQVDAKTVKQTKFDTR